MKRTHTHKICGKVKSNISTIISGLSRI